MGRVGILGGTFNPPHIGHLACARRAREQLDLDRVELVVAGRPPHKDICDPGVGHRLAMCRLAAAGADWLSVSELEAERAGPSYTITTLREINAHEPGDELTLIVGGDMALTLPSWEEPAAILELARLAVAERAGQRRDAVLEQLRRLPGGEDAVFLDMPHVDVSSSQVRDEARAGRPIHHLVPDQVADYIEQRRLYA
ncbi:MAG TPA: nicotinate (nicotinamide) nucleotide adenylyltransferase [Solirubrobacteraceae bacterium]|nr:nicotinate (nicotinamide) nucleotide adenylyltransferase [Solirubrobacteraceae bacterium]